VRLAVIIPAHNEAHEIGHALTSLPRGSEAIIVDSGSTDGTLRVVRQLTRRRMKLLRLPGQPRGALLNAGARRTRGEVLLFLHADTRLPRGAETIIVRALRDPKVAGGAFSLSFAPNRFPYSLIAAGANLRSRLLSLPYGDQALFVRRNAFQALRGFKPWPLMEDIDFVKRLKQRGRLVILPERVRTSARRYEQLGVLQTVLINLWLLLRFLLGASPRRLARTYWRG